MKKRIFSIMDTGRKRAGALVICLAVLLTIGTGAAFAITANENVEMTIRFEDETFDSLACLEQLGLTEFGVTIDEEAQAAYYNGESIAAFADNQTTYSFNGIWIGLADEGVFIRPVKDSAGNYIDVEVIPQADIESGKAGFTRAQEDEVYEADAQATDEVDAAADESAKADDEAEPSYSAAIVDSHGHEVNLGDFSTKEAAQAAVDAYVSAQIDLGSMTRQEADELRETMVQQW